jgi:hypothetical protein
VNAIGYGKLLLKGIMMGIKIADIEDIKKKMNELPEVNSLEREVSKKEAIKLMAEEIVQLQKRGYSTEMIAEFISNSGLQISVQTLKSYLTKAKAGSRQKLPKKLSTRLSSELDQEKRKTLSKASLKEQSMELNEERITEHLNEPILDKKSGRFEAREDSTDI